MEYFYGGGGNSNPDFSYRFVLSRLTTEMWKWCEAYPLNGPFERWHVKHSYKVHGFTMGNATADVPELPLIQFESRKAAYMFKLAYSEHILKDETYSFVKGLDEPFN